MSSPPADLDDAGWLSWTQDALARVSVRTRALRLDDHPAYGVDLQTGRVSFGGSDGGVRLRLQGQFVGTTNGRDWLWAWANPVWDAPVLEAVRRARDVGETRGVHQLTHPNLIDPELDDLAWRMTAAVAEITDAAGMYRSAAEPGSPHILYMVLTDPQPVSSS
jgi:hypothetical protein